MAPREDYVVNKKYYKDQINDRQDVKHKITYMAIRRLYKLARRQIHFFIQNSYRRSKLGGHGRIIEVDESVFATVKRDGLTEQIWVLGFYERGTREARAIHVKDRTEETLT